LVIPRREPEHLARYGSITGNADQAGEPDTVTAADAATLAFKNDGRHPFMAGIDPGLTNERGAD